jgi:hypothetical protein
MMSDEEAPKPASRFGWKDIYEKTLVAVLTAAILGLGAIIWNGLSSRGFVRLLGGVTSEELKAQVKEEVNRYAFSLFVPADGAVVPFAKECPPGWAASKQTIGSAIVGAGAVRTSETGYSVGDTYRLEGTGTFVGKGYDPTKWVITKAKTPAETLADDSNQGAFPISHYVLGVHSALMPTFLPLIYCRQLLPNR